jgi:hypothetical protein
VYSNRPEAVGREKALGDEPGIGLGHIYINDCFAPTGQTGQCDGQDAICRLTNPEDINDPGWWKA